MRPAQGLIRASCAVTRLAQAGPVLRSLVGLLIDSLEVGRDTLRLPSTPLASLPSHDYCCVWSATDPYRPFSERGLGVLDASGCRERSRDPSQLR